jgi:hypothetical protein
MKTNAIRHALWANLSLWGRLFCVAALRIVHSTFNTHARQQSSLHMNAAQLQQLW